MYVTTLFTHALESWSIHSESSGSYVTICTLPPSYSHNYSGTLLFLVPPTMLLQALPYTFSPLFPSCKSLNIFLFVYIVDLSHSLSLTKNSNI